MSRGPENLIISPSGTKSSWGGRRPGAGRPRSDESYRAQVEKARAIKAHHTYSRTDLWRFDFIEKYAHPLVYTLSIAWDKSVHDWNVSYGNLPARPHVRTTLLSKRKAYELCKAARVLSDDLNEQKVIQLEWLFAESQFSETLVKLVAQYEEDERCAGVQGWAKFVKTTKANRE